MFINDEKVEGMQKAFIWAIIDYWDVIDPDTKFQKQELRDIKRMMYSR